MGQNYNQEALQKVEWGFFHLFQNKKVKTDFSSYRQSRRI
ncbi:hypothetical protein LEP1GSC016_4341 [Leptospira borgpetersenii serovar Hardjo-bovis str. Sponselee]|uniref:Uncharacterized protein n=2 Tax=Leptospira borgpetersenii TaxID=174 RepID=M6C6Z1_LEPBO|nr:hypothetical protein LEP1GSC016_4341 [Leptospira borgpetersenii serovar Hardjo-bovis str. Sponselee]EMO63497.1 hypothetical protein LEP1GSC133_4805 [Leptospira borgpetersenii serovar Pomona str. 200901868]